MLPVPKELADDPRFEAALELCEDIYLKTGEVAAHLRITPEHLRQLRNSGRGPAYLKFLHGGVRYKLGEVLRYCLAAEVKPKGGRHGR